MLKEDNKPAIKIVRSCDSKTIMEGGGSAIPPMLISLDEAKVILGGISESLMRKLVREGQIRSIKVGRRRMIRSVELEFFVRRQEQQEQGQQE